MCWYKLETCPYPHHDPIRALIFYPTNASKWEQCDKPKPWGRLSCGNLIVQHTDTRQENSHPHITADCKWCSAVLKLVGTKSKEIQQQAHKEIVELEDKFNANPQGGKFKETIEWLERELTKMRNAAWELRLAEDTDVVKGAQ
ncbi:hypothetical protein H2200_004436 [Cladophialophora chaetospira]|uniref:Uncharacterized protein n=1 Tax=Cladophialophora chaetospira TaxID=386627 RepID=A0AA39CK67_9EURO|nr:hypothetical protein H2200_004436 [Cladophialophora chaetospira]